MIENNRRLLTGDDINIILDEAIRVGMLHNEDGTPVKKKDIDTEDREWLMMAFLEFLIVTGSEKISKFIVAKA
jgi:hypothetical protein